MNNKHDKPADPQPDWRRSLPREAFHQIILTLRGALPPPATDKPADLVRRDRAAVAAVAALLPVNAAEGQLAAQVVAADAWAMDCLRLAGERRREFEVARKCRAQAMSMMREAKSALRMLLRLQAARRKTEADEALANQAAWAEHAAVEMMAEALDAAPAGSQDDFSPVSKHGTDSRHTRRETEARPPAGRRVEGRQGEGLRPLDPRQRQAFGIHPFVWEGEEGRR